MEKIYYLNSEAPPTYDDKKEIAIPLEPKDFMVFEMFEGILNKLEKLRLRL